MGERYKRAWYRKSEPRVTQILFLILPLLCINCFMRLIIYPHLFNIGFPVVHSRNYFFCHNSNNLLHKVVLVALVSKDIWKDLTGMFTKVQLSYLSWWFLVPLPAILWQGQSTGLVIYGDFVCLFLKKWLKNKWGQNKKKILKLDSRVKFVGGCWVMADAQINWGSTGFRLGDRLLVSLCFFLISAQHFYRRDEAQLGNMYVLINYETD